MLRWPVERVFITKNEVNLLAIAGDLASGADPTDAVPHPRGWFLGQVLAYN